MARRKGMVSTRAAKPKGDPQGDAGRRERVFELKVQGFSVQQIARQLGCSMETVKRISLKPDFVEEVAQFRDERRDAIGHRLETAADTAAISLLTTARGRIRNADGSETPIDPAVAREQTRAAQLILTTVGFTTTRVKTVSAPQEVITRSGPAVSDAEMARLQRLHQSVFGEDDE